MKKKMTPEMAKDIWGSSSVVDRGGEAMLRIEVYHVSGLDAYEGLSEGYHPQQKFFEVWFCVDKVIKALEPSFLKSMLKAAAEAVVSEGRLFFCESSGQPVYEVSVEKRHYALIKWRKGILNPSMSTVRIPKRIVDKELGIATMTPELASDIMLKAHEQYHWEKNAFPLSCIVLKEDFESFEEISEIEGFVGFETPIVKHGLFQEWKPLETKDLLNMLRSQVYALFDANKVCDISNAYNVWKNKQDKDEEFYLCVPHVTWEGVELVEETKEKLEPGRFYLAMKMRGEGYESRKARTICIMDIGDLWDRKEQQKLGQFMHLCYTYGKQEGLEQMLELNMIMNISLAKNNDIVPRDKMKKKFAELADIGFANNFGVENKDK